MLPWSRKMFPGTNLQDLNLDWILRKISALRGGSTGQYLYKKSDKDFDFGWKTGGGGGGGTSDYLDLDNKPSINNVELTGNKTAADLGLAAASDIPAVPVQSVNGMTGAVNLTASDLGAYVKPAAGIPKTDLSNDVQTSLNKADTALQAVPPTYRTATAQDAIDAAQNTQIEAIAGSLSTIESSPAAAGHTVGEYIVYNGRLYKVTAAIAAGQTLTVGTNIEAVKLAEDVKILNDKDKTYRVTTGINGINVFLKGNLALLSVTGFQFTASARGWYQITTLPATIHPTSFTVFTGFDNRGDNILLECMVRTDGTFSVYAWAAQEYELRCNATFFTSEDGTI